MKSEMQALTDIALKVSRLEVMQETNTKAIGEMAANVSRLVDRLEASDDIARAAERLAESAHRRVDEANARLEQVQDDIKWLWKTVIGTIITGGFGGAIALLWKAIGA